MVLALIVKSVVHFELVFEHFGMWGRKSTSFTCMLKSTVLSVSVKDTVHSTLNELSTVLKKFGTIDV
jgi:hypothetical protein